MIYKYQLAYQTEQTIDLPLGYKVLSAQMQGGVGVVWVLQDTGFDRTWPVKFYIFNTGTPIPDENLTFIDTIQFGGGLVAHVFYEKS
jgi:hypothetical protein